MQKPSSLKTELKRLVNVTGNKRRFLLQLGQKRARNKKYLTIGAGILALLSATTVTSIFSTSLGKEANSWFAAVTAFISGIITLIISNYHNEDDIVNIFTGASRFLVLRDKANHQYNNSVSSPEMDEKVLIELHQEYHKIDEAYAKHIQVNDKYIKYYNSDDYYIQNYYK